jgi:hypothetical protein
MAAAADEGATRTPSRRRAAAVGAALLACGLGGLGAGPLASSALMTDSAATTSTTVSSGNVSLALSDGGASGSWTGALSLAPGAVAYAGITVTNDGASRLRYSVTSLSSSSLAADLVLDVVTIPTAGTCSASTFAAGTAVAGPLAIGATPALAVVGDVTTGAQQGDRTLAAGAAERLCARVGFPSGTGLGAAAQGTTASATFAFVGENA